ncbi:MAG TPA: bifunctional phosphoribosylaminoimidazolecarboxamide formyltransferase/IMP cyclohydrolase [Thermoplasmata archaeon]|nr:bifunctional phosphoribosylaminoimidazolecarboxamide formyltransferase/IMP cyclohydrolase [Thermoplasmata archaeon]
MAPDSDPPVTLRRALLSVSDRSGLTEFAQGLARHSIEIVATSGTRAALEGTELAVRSAEELTGVGAWFDGRIKTLHPGLLGGILAPRTEAGVAELERRGLLPIDLVVTNFYPFQRRLAEDPTRPEREEHIDIGGVTLARAAAKNHRWVAVVTDPAEYPVVAAELAALHGSISAATRVRLAAQAFGRTARYDEFIAGHLTPPVPTTLEGGAPTPFPERAVFSRDPIRPRYGENPHQATAAYGLDDPPGLLEPWPLELLQGAALSFTNLLDLDTALATVSEFPTPTAAVVKHTTPCGAASGATIGEAIERAVATDPVARYGCVIAVNRPLDAADLGALHGVFVDALAAPGFSPEAIAALGRRAKAKVVRIEPPSIERPRWEAHSALGRLLLQETDRRQLAPGDFRPVTTARATPQEACALDFAWRVVRHAKSNAIVLADGSKTVGIGSGQPTRVKAVELAVGVAGPRANGSVLASDAFFPFPDGVEVAAQAGVRAIVQPGGSLRDPEVIAAAERHQVAMYCTGWRVFRH